MAQLIDEARARRVEAQRLRAEANGLRFATRQKLVRSRDALGEARAQCERVKQRRSAPEPSPWSGLLWHRPDESVDRALLR